MRERSRWCYTSVLGRQGRRGPSARAASPRTWVRHLAPVAELVDHVARPGWVAMSVVRYLSPRFHPSRHIDARKIEHWLTQHVDAVAPGTGSFT